MFRQPHSFLTVDQQILSLLVFEGDGLGVIHPEPVSLHQLGEVLRRDIAIAVLVHCGHPAVVLMPKPES